MRWQSLVAILVVICALGGSQLACGAGPSVSWVAPYEGADTYGIVRLEVGIGGSEVIEAVSFFLDEVSPSQLIARVDGPPEESAHAVWYTTQVPNGEHVLLAVATTADGQSTQAERRMLVRNVSREEAIPPGSVKVTPETDQHPPILNPAFSGIWDDPVPLEGPINSAGGEDSPFISPDGKRFIFWFTPDVSVEPQYQIRDRSTGLYWSHRLEGGWSEPERIHLNYFDEQDLIGSHTLYEDTLWFASLREGGYRMMDFYTAQLPEGRWTDWQNAGRRLNQEIEIGEMHVLPGGTEIYFDSRRAGGMGEKDLWVTRLVGGEWLDPENIEAVNTHSNEGWPYVTPDGNELWYTAQAMGAPGIYRSLKVDGAWQPPELVLSSFAGEPSLDLEGNIYFAHHFWDDATNSMIEADFYVCYHK